MTGIVNAQTKQETVDFLKKKMCFKQLSNGTTHIHKIDITGCRMTMTYVNKQQDGSKSETIIIVNLKDLDPTRLELDLPSSPEYAPNVALRAREDKKAILWKMPNNKYIKEKYDNTAFARNAREAIQLKKAFSHLIKLCGGKGELF